jgi:hypothetical protein
LLLVNDLLWIGHPREDEILPKELRIDLPKRNSHWTWVAYDNEQPVAALYAADFHGMVFLNALKAIPGVQAGIVIRLLREVARCCLRRGFTQFLSYFQTDKPSELKMMRIMKNLGAGFRASSGAWGLAYIPQHKGWK